MTVFMANNWTVYNFRGGKDDERNTVPYVLYMFLLGSRYCVSRYNCRDIYIQYI